MRAAPLLQPVRQTPAMQAMQANLPPAKNTSGNRAIVPKKSTGPVRRMIEPVNGGLPGTQIPSNQQGGSGTGTSTDGGLLSPQPKTTSQSVEPTQQTTGGYANNGSQAPAIPAATQTPASDYQMAQVDPNASVAQQLNSLLASDNPYLQQARLRAEQESAARGLRNSTLGVQAGEQAAISAALPIAQQEAGQQFQLQQLNEQRKITERRDQLLNQMQNNRDTRLFAMDMQKLQQNFENDLGKMGVEMSHQNRIAYTNSASALINSAMEQVSAIYQNPNMDVVQQRNAVRQVYQDLNSRFSALADIYQPLPGVDFEPQQQ